MQMTFFANYYNEQSGESVAQYANLYLDENALIIDKKTIMTLNGRYSLNGRASASVCPECQEGVRLQPDNWKDS